MRTPTLSICLLAAAGCTRLVGIDGLQRNAPAPRVVRLLDLTALSSPEGVPLAVEEGFRGLQVTASGAAGPVSVEIRLPGGAWQRLEQPEQIDGTANAHLAFDAPTQAADLRVTAPVAFAQLSLHADDIVWDDDPREMPGARAIPGRWIMPDEIWAIGQTMYLPYEPADACYGSTRSGARTVGDWLVQHFGATAYGGYNCRNIGGTNTLSVHATGLRSTP